MAWGAQRAGRQTRISAKVFTPRTAGPGLLPLLIACVTAGVISGVNAGWAQVRTQTRIAPPGPGPYSRETSPTVPVRPVDPEPGPTPEQPRLPVAVAPLEALPSTADAVIEQMAESAGVIFAGQVTAVRRPTGYIGSAQDAAEGVVEIDFRVVRALRGPRQGSVYTLREWSGLWAGDAERFRVGRQLLLFLRNPDASGLSSPVHGADGAIPLRGGGIAPGPEDTTVASAEWLVDLRWVETRAVRVAWLKNPMPVRQPVVDRDPGRHPRRRGLQSDLEPAPSPAVRLEPDPWAPPTASVTDTKPLSQVLQLCVNAMRVPHVPVR